MTERYLSSLRSQSQLCRIVCKECCTVHGLIQINKVAIKGKACRERERVFFNPAGLPGRIGVVEDSCINTPEENQADIQDRSMGYER